MQLTTFVSQAHHFEITELRKQEYAKASGFHLDLSTLSWKQSDDDSFVMALQVDGEIVATMRGEIIQDQAVLEKKLECPWNFALNLKFPILLLSRAATDSRYRSQGLNLIQRYWFLKLAQHHQIPFVLGTFVSGSPRENTLREMGYQFFVNEKGWQESTYRSTRPVQVVALDMETDGERALEYCEQHGAVHEYPLEGDFPAIKIVETI